MASCSDLKLNVYEEGRDFVENKLTVRCACGWMSRVDMERVHRMETMGILQVCTFLREIHDLSPAMPLLWEGDQA